MSLLQDLQQLDPRDPGRWPLPVRLGAAALARMALDPSLSPSEVVGGWAPAASYEPRMSADEAAQLLGNWRAAVDRVMPEVSA